MIVVAAIAVALNVTISVWLHAGAKHDLNVRSAYLHMAGDAVSALGVVVAGIVVVLGGPPSADAVASFLIGGLILWSSWGILKESVNVLLEGTPFGMDMAAVETAIAAVPGVINVHDLHVWTVGSGVIACSCHVRVEEQTIREGQLILKSIVNARGTISGSTTQPCNSKSKVTKPTISIARCANAAAQRCITAITTSSNGTVGPRTAGATMA